MYKKLHLGGIYLRKILTLTMSTLILLLTIITAVHASDSEQIIKRWTKERYYENTEGANLTISAVYYSSEYIEANVLEEARKNLWTQSEVDDYKYNFLSALQLSEMIPIKIKFINNGPSMHVGPFDIMVKLKVNGKLYKPVDYDKRFNFKFQGEKEVLVYFPRYDTKSGKELLKGAKTISLEISSAVSTTLDGKNVTFLWDVNKDDPSKLYQGKAAERFESDRLIKRLEKLRKDKTTLESQLKAVDDEIGTIQTRLDELAKK